MSISIAARPTGAPLIAAARAELAIETNGLGRQFGEFTAVKNVSFAVRAGEVFGFLGPNGAGKSTTIKMLCTLLRPTAGSASVNGYDVVGQPDEVRSSIGIIFQDFSLDDRITAEENLKFHCMIYHVPPSERPARIARMLEMVGLTDRAHDRVRFFSGGMRRRLEIARGLLHRPAVLFLDEPTVGLDPQTRRTIWEHIHELRREHGITVFMTTHYMDEAENCDRIAIMDHAEVIALDTPAALKASLGGDIVRITADDPFAAAEALRRDYGLAPLSENGGLRFEVANAGEFVPRLLRELPVPIRSLDMTKPTLEDVFLHLTGRAIRTDGADEHERLRNAFKKRAKRGA